LTLNSLVDYGPFSGHLGEYTLFILCECLAAFSSALVNLSLALRIANFKHGGVLALSEQRLLCLDHICDISDALIVQEGLVIVLKGKVWVGC